MRSDPVVGTDTAVDVGRSFDAGMVYVALSRAVSIDSLQVLRFAASKVMVVRLRSVCRLR